MALHTYKICEVLPRDPEQMGRPRREDLITLKDLNDEELALMRSLQEPRLRAGTVAVLNGRIVARGPEVADDDADDDADDQGDAEDHGDGEDRGDANGHDDARDEAPSPRPTDPVGVTKHATDMLWDAYQRHAAASAELREQTNELNRRAIAQAKQLDEALSSIQHRQPPPPITISMDDVSNFVRVSMSVVRDMMGDKESGKK